LPSPDFFDIYNIGESPRTSFPGNDTFSEKPEPEKEPDSSPEEIDEEFVDTSIDFVDQNGIEKSVKRTFSGPKNREKRQSQGFWYWLNNFNDGKTCYAALPGDTVRFRAFPCSDLLRTICQQSPTDKKPLIIQPPKPQPQKNNDIFIQQAQEPLQNQVPDPIIRANPKEPLFARNGLVNPYLNYHAKILNKQRRQQQAQQQLKRRLFLTSQPQILRQTQRPKTLGGVRIFFGL